jgi:tetratricopeptide (TPR) repeat protein
MRTLDEVRRARELWRAAAAADPQALDAFAGTARASVWLTEHDPDATAREADAKLAVEAAHWCAWTWPKSATCWYWLGAALGVRAREHPTTALGSLDEILAAFERARALDPQLEDAGPDRAMALVYLRAPGWPVGPGDPGHGLRHAHQAVRMRPDYPPNLLALGEALAANEQKEEAVAQYTRAQEAARELASKGDPDGGEWARAAHEALSALR